MRIIRASEQTVVPWKNGGGTATNIVASPEGAGFDAFDWRLSGAHVAQAGPFSHFPDADRIMLILSEGELVLEGAGPELVTLTKASKPFAFPGDVAVSATVPKGPIDNLNVMVDRRHYRAKAWRSALPFAETLRPEGTLLVYCESGEIRVGSEALAVGDTAVSTEPLTMSAAPDSQAILVLVTPRS
jgi:environmental stress-induced protein Ves